MISQLTVCLSAPPTHFITIPDFLAAAAIIILRKELHRDLQPEWSEDHRFNKASYLCPFTLNLVKLHIPYIYLHKILKYLYWFQIFIIKIKTSRNPVRAVLERTAKEFRENVLSRHFYDHHKFPGVRTILARAGLSQNSHLLRSQTGTRGQPDDESRGRENRRERRNKLSAPLMKQI